jgi:hypothetical protein
MRKLGWAPLLLLVLHGGLAALGPQVSALTGILPPTRSTAATPPAVDYPVLRIVALTENADGWTHVCTMVAIQPDEGLTAGHCVGREVVIRVRYWYYWVTGYRQVVQQGVGRDLAVFRFPPSEYHGGRAVLLQEPLAVGTALYFVGYPRGVRMETWCRYEGSWAALYGPTAVPRYAGVATCNHALADGASGGPLFTASTPGAPVAGIVTHLWQANGDRVRSSKRVAFMMFPDAQRLLIGRE